MHTEGKTLQRKRVLRGLVEELGSSHQRGKRPLDKTLTLYIFAHSPTDMGCTGRLCIKRLKHPHAEVIQTLTVREAKEVSKEVVEPFQEVRKGVVEPFHVVNKLSDSTYHIQDLLPASTFTSTDWSHAHQISIPQISIPQVPFAPNCLLTRQHKKTLEITTLLVELAEDCLLLLQTYITVVSKHIQNTPIDFYINSHCTLLCNINCFLHLPYYTQ